MTCFQFPIKLILGMSAKITWSHVQFRNSLWGKEQFQRSFPIRETRMPGVYMNTPGSYLFHSFHCQTVRSYSRLFVHNEGSLSMQNLESLLEWLQGRPGKSFWMMLCWYFEYFQGVDSIRMCSSLTWDIPFPPNATAFRQKTKGFIQIVNSEERINAQGRYRIWNSFTQI